MKFGERLEYLVEECERTQREVSDDLHIAPTTLNGYIKGNREPDYGTLVRIADYFDVTTDYLLGVTNIRKRANEPLDVREGDLVGIYRSMQPDNQDLLIEQARLFYKHDAKRRSGKSKMINKDII